MKKKLYVTAMLTIVAISGYIVAGRESAEQKLSAIELANVEALGGSEIGGITCNYPTHGMCWTANMNEGPYIYEGIVYRPCLFSGKQHDYCKEPC